MDSSLCSSAGHSVFNGNGNLRNHGSKGSPESGSSWLEESCNGHGGGPMRFSSPGSGLSGMSGSLLSATSESALSTLSGYSTGRDSRRSVLSSSCKWFQYILIIQLHFYYILDLSFSYMFIAL